MTTPIDIKEAEYLLKQAGVSEHIAPAFIRQCDGVPDKPDHVYKEQVNNFTKFYPYMGDDIAFSVYEGCPNCGCENELVTSLPLTDCKHCGHKEVLPCAACEWGRDNCDWNEETRCTPFPLKKKKIIKE